MEKQTKERLTREFIASELAFYVRADIRSSTVLAIAATPVFALIAWLMAVAVRELTDHPVWRSLLSMFFVLLMLSPVLFTVYFLARAVMFARMLRQNAFDVIKRQVQYKEEKYTRDRCVEVLHFEGFPPIEVGHTVYQLADAEDEFYLVTLRTRRPTVRLLYAAERYEYVG